MTAPKLAVGQTVALGSEMLLVTGISGNQVTVSRGLNGSTAAGHAEYSSLGILRSPAAVERAALIQAARIWTRAADFEPFYVDADVDTDVRLLLEAYRKSPTVTDRQRRAERYNRLGYGKKIGTLDATTSCFIAAWRHAATGWYAPLAGTMDATAIGATRMGATSSRRRTLTPAAYPAP